MLPTGNESAVWAEPRRVCVVEYMPNTLQSLRQPVFKGFRDDIYPEEVKVRDVAFSDCLRWNRIAAGRFLSVYSVYLMIRNYLSLFLVSLHIV